MQLLFTVEWSSLIMFIISATRNKTIARSEVVAPTATCRSSTSKMWPTSTPGTGQHTVWAVGPPLGVGDRAELNPHRAMSCRAMSCRTNSLFSIWWFSIRRFSIQFLTIRHFEHFCTVGSWKKKSKNNRNILFVQFFFEKKRKEEKSNRW